MTLRLATPALRRRTVVAALGFGSLYPSLARAEPQAIYRPWPRERTTPPLTLPGLDGAPWSSAAARGRVLLLHFWAGWCEPCRAEMPALDAWARQHAPRGVQVMAINYREGEAVIRRFLDQNPSSLGLPILRDADGGAARAWDVRVFPTTVVIARDGRPAFSLIGEVDWAGESLRQWMAPLLTP
jgi:thiol-disulfide isomerase/thioredoxin